MNLTPSGQSCAGVWSDIVWSVSEGFVLVVSSPTHVTATRVSDGAVLWSVSTASMMPYLRALAVPTGDVIALAQDGRSNAATVFSAAGAVLLNTWPVVAQNGCLLSLEGDQPIGYVQVTGTTYVRQPLGAPAVTPQAIPIGPTSQGWLDYDPGRGGLVWTDPNRIVTLNGMQYVCAMARDHAWTGQSNKKQTGSLLFLVALGTGNYVASPTPSAGPLPHIASDGAGHFAVSCPLSSGYTTVVCGPPFTPYVPPDPPHPQPPNPIPPIPPQPPDVLRSGSLLFPFL